MPIYEYECSACGHKFEKFVRSMSTSFVVACPECHSAECKKQFSMFGSSSSSSTGSSVSSGANCAPGG